MHSVGKVSRLCQGTVYAAPFCFVPFCEVPDECTCVGVLLIRALVVTVFCIVVLCFRYCFVYVCLFLFVSSVLV
jgi:hypothetical protein